MKEIYLLEDIIMIANYRNWKTADGDHKADKLIKEIEAGKYGHTNSVWAQAKDATKYLGIQIGVFNDPFSP